VRDATRLKVVHRQRVLRHGDAEPAPSFVRGAHPTRVLASAADGWQRLLETEYESVVISSWMTAALARLAAPLDLLGAFGRVVEDEIRHVDVCAQMVDALGGQPLVPSGALPPLPGGLERDSESEFETVSGLVGFFCVFEFLSALVFHQALEAAADELPRWALGEIHRDEAFHGAFGFEAARHFVPAWSEDRRVRLARRVEAEVARFEQRLGGPLPAEAALAPLSPEVTALEQLGLLSPPHLLTTFYAGVAGQLVPRLLELGIPVELKVDLARSDS